MDSLSSLDLGREFSTRVILLHTAIADRLGLSATDHKALGFLLQEGGTTAGRLTELTGLTSGAVTGIIDRLEKGGFVRRVIPSADRRQVRIEPIPERLPEIDALFVPMTTSFEALLGQYSPEEQALLLNFLGKILILLEEETRRLSQSDGHLGHKSDR